MLPGSTSAGSSPVGSGATGSWPAESWSVAGVGIDVVDVERFRAVLARRPGLVDRVFTLDEQGDVARGGDRAQRLAARFAAKEAVMKALGVGIGGVRFADIEVVRSEGAISTRGAPTLRLGDSAATWATKRGIRRWHLSLSHTELVATAMVVAERTT